MEQITKVPKVQAVDTIVEVPVAKKLRRVAEVPQIQKVYEDEIVERQIRQQQVDPKALEAMMSQLAGKQPKRYAKAMQKMGLKPEAAVLNVRIKKSSGMAFSINKPEVYRFPGTDTFVMFGDAQVEEATADAANAAAAAVTQPAAAAPAKKEEPEDETEEDPGLIGRVLVAVSELVVSSVELYLLFFATCVVTVIYNSQ